MLLVYQIKVGLCLIAFYLLFRLLLSHDTLHRFNRLLVLAMVGLSLVLPWVRVSMEQPSPVAEGMVVIEELLAVQPVATELQPAGRVAGLSLAYLIYYIGAAVVLLWHLASALRLHWLMQRAVSKEQSGGAVVCVMQDDVAPFSYLNHIVISQRDYREHSQEILTHELAHIRLLHWADVLLMNVLSIFQWWNPAAWLLRVELQQIHEYEADEAVLKRGVDAQQYQLLLIRKSVGDQLFSMANNLNHQSLKRRIRMMTTRKSSGWQRLKLLAVLPVAAMAVMAFAHPKVEKVTRQMEAADTVVNTPDPKYFDVVEQMPEFPGGTAELMKFLSMNVRYPKEALEQRVQGRVIVSFIVERDGSVSDTKVVRSIHPQLDAEALRVVGTMPKWKAGMQNGEPVRVKYTVPISFLLTGQKDKAETEPYVQAYKVAVEREKAPADGPSVKLIEQAYKASQGPKASFSMQNVKVIIDGKDVVNDITLVGASNVESIHVLKDEESLKKYGAEGKQAVILIYRKK